MFKRISNLESAVEDMKATVLAQHYILHVLLQNMPKDYALRCIARDLPDELETFLLNTKASDNVIKTAKVLTTTGFKALLKATEQG